MLIVMALMGYRIFSLGILIEKQDELINKQDDLIAVQEQITIVQSKTIDLLYQP
jgi:hypothetical protein